MSEPANSLVILDRDGVINHDSDDYIKSVSEWVPIPGSIEAIIRLSKAGFTVAVATNQSGLGRGYFPEEVLTAMHAKLYELVTEGGGAISHIAYCPHRPEELCSCRKPKPGLLHQISAALTMPLKHAWFVGDTQKDIEVALSTECRPILVRTGKGASTESKLTPTMRNSISIVDNLSQAAELIMHQARPV